ncbi:MAG: NAD-dependent epimerase/dehydratase family protein [bacterium]|nr:NAD-dependent epimerase/dehydratase family protein [bacterium]
MKSDFWKNKKVLVTGGRGFIGTHLVDKLKFLKPKELRVPVRNEANLMSFKDCLKITKNIDIVIHLAANIGDVNYLNLYSAEIYDDNVIMSSNIIRASMRSGVEKLINFGSTYIYPKRAKLPLSEDQIWNGLPSKSGMFYGLAKRSILSQMLAYRDQYAFNSIFLVPVNIYGPGDNFDGKDKKVIPSLIIKFIESQKYKNKSVKIWGTGEATRDFLYISDLIDGIILVAEKYNESLPLNLGSGKNISISELAFLLKKITNYKGEILWDDTKPEGILNSEISTELIKEKIGFKAKVSLVEGLTNTINWYLTKCL